MNIILGSLNPSKKRSVEIALSNLGVGNYNIVCFDVPSNVSSKPINNEIILGARNRNHNLKKECINNDISYNYLISIEGGFVAENDRYYMVTYAVIENFDGIEFVGKSAVLEITKKMFEYVKSGNSLNKLIEEINGTEKNKTKGGITGYLTDSEEIYNRSTNDSWSVMGALIPFINYKKYNELDEMIDKKMVKKININR
jgi:inosine/xanthosine triphosphatase